jgi:L-ascorbate metabolism protein UlaG (beta-lactamase superfamily)
MNRAINACVVTFLLATAHAHDTPGAHVRHVANAGVMVVNGDSKLIFDPLFDNTFDTYDAIPPDMRAAIVAGDAPWDDVDAIFISHYHEDHFDPAAIIQLMEQQSAVQIYGPGQAMNALLDLLGDDAEPSTRARIHSIDLGLGDPAESIRNGSMSIDAIRLPHAGWPARHKDVENIVFRVTLEEDLTVMHFGDAGTADEHFRVQRGFWSRRRPDLALPPYWFFLNDEGRRILATRIKARQTIGVHVPAEVPDEPARRPEALRDVDVFTRPGDVRKIELAE